MSDIIDRLRSSDPDFDDCEDAAEEITRLRAELVEANGQINRCVDQNKYLESQLTEARKPDCRMCSYFMPRVRACCVPGIDCNNGDRFEDIFNTEPVRLYEKEGKV